MVRAKLRIDNASKKKRPFMLESFQPSGKLNIDNMKTKLTNFIETNKTSNIQDKYEKLQELLTMRKEKDKTSEHNKANKNISETTRQLMDSRTKLIGLENKTKDTRREIGRLSKEIKKNIRKERQYRRQGLIEKYIAMTGGIKKAIKHLNNRTEWIPNMKDVKGKCKTRRPDIINIATNFFKDLYTNRQEKTIETTLKDDNETNIPKILEREVEKAIETQKRDKAPGPDRITNDLLLEIKEYITPVPTNMFNEILAKEEIPKQWSESVIILLHKKGDKNNISNYRPISLMSNIYKTFAKVILQRITRNLDENQPREQAGFRSGYSTLDHILVVKQIFEKSKEFNTPFYCCFVDYSKAFDSLNHDDIWQALKHQGVEPKYIRMIRNIYKTSKAKIKLERKGTEINIERGVRQGDPLSPKLFSAVLEQVFRNINWENCGLTINGETLSHLRFADDIIIFASSFEQLQDMLQELQKESRKVGLTINTEKTKAMTNWETHPINDMNNTNIDYVNEYIYLGQLISPTDMMQKEIETRIGNAWKRYWSLKEERRNKQTKDKHHLMWVNPINMKRGNKKVDPLVPNMEFLNIGSKQYSENASKKNYLDFSDPVSLLQYRVQCRSSRPARLRALLCNVPGVALLAVSSRADHAFLAHDLQHLLINCFFEVSPYSYIEKQDFLNRLIMLQRTMLEGLPVVTNFLGQYIPFWNEKDYFAEILDLVEWLNVENPEQVMTIVDILSRVYHRSTPMQQCAILRSLTNMYTNMIYSRTRKEHYFMTSTPSQASYNQLLPQIAASLSDLCNKGLQVAPDDIRVLYTSMWSAERTSLAERQTRAPLGALPGRLTLALPLLGQSAALLDKIAALMLTYKHILSTMRSIVRDKSPSYTQHIQTLQAYTSDLIACLYTEAALSNQSTGLVFQKLLPELVSTLSCLCPDVDAKFSLRNHIAFAPYTYMQLEAIDHSETSNKIWFDTVIDHEFPNLSKFLKKAVSELR